MPATLRAGSLHNSKSLIWATEYPRPTEQPRGVVVIIRDSGSLDSSSNLDGATLIILETVPRADEELLEYLYHYHLFLFFLINRKTKGTTTIITKIPIIRKGIGFEEVGRLRFMQ